MGATQPQAGRPAAGQPDGNPRSGEDMAFHFVQALAAELSGGKVELPGFPQIVLRVQRVLSDVKADANRVVQVIGGEPVLSAQLMRMANSAALNPARAPVTDLRAAVARVGLDTVRTATIACAVQQLRAAPQLRGFERQLDALWQRSILVASLCHVIATRLTRVNPDTALLAGMLQGIGKLYILTRASGHRSLFSDEASYQTIEHDWHLSIAAALLENWGFGEEIVQAVHDSESPERDLRGGVGLSDVLSVGVLLAEHHAQPHVIKAQVNSAKLLQRLQLDESACESFIADSTQAVNGLREALGGA
jgi:HD-like signal output (HDOD) protein